MQYAFRTLQEHHFLREHYVLTHPEFAAQLGRNGHEHVKENFVMTTNVRRWLLLLEILLRGGKA
ncbi:MAG TPA: hypothetical protein VNW47_14805 [Terriglobales bacterium]|nr:hypothetical protein [Terriglobales bacterium]